MRILLEEMKDFIEDTKEMIECEWGRGRSTEDLIKDGDMPELYNRVLYELFKLN